MRAHGSTSDYTLAPSFASHSPDRAADVRGHAQDPHRYAPEPGEAGRALGAADLTPVQEDQFERLRAWRMARSEGLPAFRVASNAVLVEIVRARPANAQQLLAVRGVGPTFCAKHGESLLAELRRLDASYAGFTIGRDAQSQS